MHRWEKSLRGKKTPPAWQSAFLAMLPTLETRARLAFRQLAAEARAEAVQEAVGGACAAFARRVELDKIALAYPTALARFGVARTKGGRKVGGRLNVRDVSSP